MDCALSRKESANRLEKWQHFETILIDHLLASNLSHRENLEEILEGSREEFGRRRKNFRKRIFKAGSNFRRF